MAKRTAIIKKPLYSLGTSLQGREVTVIKEEIGGKFDWACKIRLMERPGVARDFWIYDRDLLAYTSDVELAKAIYG